MASIALVRAAAGQVLQAAPRVIGAISRSKVGRILGGAAVTTGTIAAGTTLAERFGRGAPKRRRSRKRGVTARDVEGARRVAMFVKEFGMRPKLAAPRKRRKRC